MCLPEAPPIGLSGVFGRRHLPGKKKKGGVSNLSGSTLKGSGLGQAGNGQPPYRGSPTQLQRHTPISY